MKILSHQKEKTNHLLFVLIITFFCISGNSYGQTNPNNPGSVNTVEGKVVDNIGISIPGVNVVIKGTTIGTTTNTDGEFTLSYEAENPVLVFSFIGMKTKEIVVVDNEPLLVIMQEGAMLLEEMVVVGYGVQEKESMLSAIDQVSGQNIEEMGASNVSAALSGLSPGLLSISNSGRPGADEANLYIRGRSSLNEDLALVVVDGIRIEGGFEYMNPEEIASISILKDAAATAVYGVEGANGVIIVTTKRGRKGPAKFSFSSDYTLKQPTSSLGLLGSYDQHYLYNIAARNDNQYDRLTSEEVLQHYADQDLPYIYPDVNWFDETVNPLSFSTRHNMTVRGGTNLVKYFTTLGYAYEGDAFKKSNLGLPFESKNDFQNISYRVNLDFSISPTTTFKTDFVGRFEERNESGDWDEIINNMFEYPSWLSPAFYPADILEQYPDPNPLAPPQGNIRFAESDLIANTGNPYISLYGDGLNTVRRNVLTTNFELEQKLDFILKGLSLSGRYNLSANYAYDQELDYRPELYILRPDGTWENLSGDDRQQEKPTLLRQRTRGKSDRYYFNVILNYNRSFGRHNITALGLWSRGTRITGSNFPDYKEDWVGRFTYNFRKKYLFEFSGAYNGTDRFLPGNQFGFFPSGSVGWDLAKESFISDNISFIDQLKIRYSLGQAGSESGSQKRMYFGTFMEYDKGDDYYRAEGTGDMFFGESFEGQGGYVRESVIGNPFATWETATKQNLGVDFGLFNKKLLGSVDFFNERRVDIFRDPTNTIPFYFGYSADFKQVNVGEVKKQGFEVSLNYSNVMKNGFNYFAKVTYGFNENRVVAESEPFLTPEHKRQTGKPIGVNEVYITNGYLNSIDEALNYPTPGFGGNQWQPGDLMYVDYNGDGVIDGEGDRLYYGLPRIPQTQYGITLGGSFKNWRAKIFATGVQNRNINANSYLVPFGDQLPAGVRDIHYDYWTPDNMDASYPTLHAVSDGFNRINQPSSFQLLNASYFRIKNVEIAYSFNTTRYQIGFEKLELSISGFNLFTVTNVEVGDPEQNGPNNYPILKRYIFGMKLGF